MEEDDFKGQFLSQGPIDEYMRMIRLIIIQLVNRKRLADGRPYFSKKDTLIMVNKFSFNVIIVSRLKCFAYIRITCMYDNVFAYDPYITIIVVTPRED